MKKLTNTVKCFLIASAIFSSNCNAQTHENSKLPPLDKLLHFTVSDIIATTTYKICEEDKNAFTKAFLIAFSTGMVKESYDCFIDGREWNWGDTKADFLGSLFGTARFKIILNFKARKKGDKSAWDKKAVFGYDY